jgi:hypothetical protein
MGNICLSDSGPGFHEDVCVDGFNWGSAEGTSEQVAFCLTIKRLSLEIRKHSDMRYDLEEKLRATIRQAAGNGIKQSDVSVVLLGGAVRVDVSVMVPRSGQVAAAFVCQRISSAIRAGGWTDFLAADLGGIRGMQNVIDGELAGGGITSPSVESVGECDYVSFCLTLQGLSTEINKRCNVKTALVKRLKELVRETVGVTAVDLKNIDIQLQSGAVLIESTISVPQAGRATAHSIIKSLQHTIYCQTWGEAVAMDLWAIPGIGSVVDGRLELGAVTNPSVKRSSQCTGEGRDKLKALKRFAEDFASSLSRHAYLTRCLGDAPCNRASIRCRGDDSEDDWMI